MPKQFPECKWMSHAFKYSLTQQPHAEALFYIFIYIYKISFLYSYWLKKVCSSASKLNSAFCIIFCWSGGGRRATQESRPQGTRRSDFNFHKISSFEGHEGRERRVKGGEIRIWKPQALPSPSPRYFFGGGGGRRGGEVRGEANSKAEGRRFPNRKLMSGRHWANMRINFRLKSSNKI